MPLAARPIFPIADRRRHSLFGVAAAVSLVVSAMGCRPPDGDEEARAGGEAGLEVGISASLTAENGLRAVNGLRARNGLTLAGGLNQAEALSPSSELMSTADGRLQVSYLVKCALPATRTLVRTDSRGTKYSFPGLIGLAPEWENAACGQTCQEWVTSCVLGLVNATGVHVPVWMMAEHPAVGFGRDASYPRQEGAFFGNIFSATPEAFYCGGRDYHVNPVLGRIGSAQVDSSYTDIYGTDGLCAGHCTGSDYPHVGDGYKACSGWNHVVTIWRQ